MINAETKTATAKRKSSSAERLLLLAIIFLTNPVVNVFDYLPDFIAYIIIIKALTYYADRAPYFDEARRDFKSLLIISLAKIPSYFIMIHARGQNTMDYDVRTLFTFVFAVLEVTFLMFALKNLFRALWYIGERTDAAAVLSPFAISKSGKRSFTPESLERISYIFIFYKAAATFLPEMLLLTRSNVNFGINLPMLYPYCIIFSVVSVFVFGVILSKRFRCYVKAIFAEGKMRSATEGMLGEEARRALSVKLNVKDMCASLTLFVIAAFSTVDIRFDNLSGINLLPSFVFGLIILIAVWRMRSHVKSVTGAFISVGIYTAVSTVGYVLESFFLENYGYASLLEKNNEAASTLRFYTLAAGCAELVALIIMFIMLARLLADFASKHTGIDAHNERYSRLDAEHHKLIKKRIYIFSAIGIIHGSASLFDAFFKFLPDTEKVYTEFGTSSITMSLVPWFTSIVLISALFYIGYSVYLFDLLKEETQQKYS